MPCFEFAHAAYLYCSHHMPATASALILRMFNLEFGIQNSDFSGVGFISRMAFLGEKR